MQTIELEKLGFSAEEAKVYLAVLELGGGYVSAIAKKAGVHRVGCYHTLDNLVEKEVLNRLTKNNMKYYSVENPQVLVNLMEEKFQHAKSILPDLLSITQAMAYKPKIQYFEGRDGIKRIFEETFNAEDEILGYTNLEKLPEIIPEKFLRDYAKRKIEAGIKTRMLSPHSKDGLNYLKKYYPKDYDLRLTEVLFINPESFMFEYEINIYGNFVSLVSLNPDELIGLIIESPVYAKTQRAIFNLAWLGATSFVAR